MARQLSRLQLIERSIVKKYRKELWNPFIAAVKRYELIQTGDRVAVSISGGKDSMLQAKLIQQLQRVSEVPFEAKYLVMDPGYHPVNRTKIQENAALLAFPSRSLTQTISPSPRASRRTAATSAPECGGDTYTAWLSRWGAIRSPWGTTLMTSLRRR